MTVHSAPAKCITNRSRKHTRKSLPIGTQQLDLAQVTLR
jgi:hypothetical protein